MRRDQSQDLRLELLRTWLGELASPPGLRPQSLRPASSDASFRRYFRVDADAAAGQTADETANESADDVAGDLQAATPAMDDAQIAAAPKQRSWIAMDAPPQSEDVRPYVHVAQLLARSAVSTPQIVAADVERGFLLLSDFGSATYADALARRPDDAPALYEDALAALLRIQHTPVDDELPVYDRERLLAEMRLFPDWYVTRHLGMVLTSAEQKALDAVFERLVDRALGQTQVLVHRDFHCRNLMVLAGRERNPGVLDFQDAVRGPVSYDVVSLLRDAYIEWPEDRQIDWAVHYWEAARASGIAVPPAFDVFWQDLEWMGLQRSLKVLGIFARLHHRDGKDRYLQDLPLVLRHTRRVVGRYDAFSALGRLLDRVHGEAPRTGFTF